MTDMVERVARAICEDEGYLPDRHYPSMRYTPAWKNFVSNARAAIAAAFKVTDEDARAFFGCDDAEIGWYVHHTNTFRDVMQTMADAALKQGVYSKETDPEIEKYI